MKTIIFILSFLILGCGQEPDYTTSQGTRVFSQGFDVNFTELDTIMDIFAEHTPECIKEVKTGQILKAMSFSTIFFYNQSESKLGGYIIIPGNEIHLSFQCWQNSITHELLHEVQDITHRDTGIELPQSTYLRVCKPYVDQLIEGG